MMKDKQYETREDHFVWSWKQELISKKVFSAGAMQDILDSGGVSTSEDQDGFSSALENDTLGESESEKHSMATLKAIARETRTEFNWQLFDTPFIFTTPVSFGGSDYES